MKIEKWTIDEVNYLIKTYPAFESNGCVELHSKYTLKSITAKARRLGLKSIRFNKWTVDEDNILFDAWRFDTMPELLKKFPNRTYDSISARAIKTLKVKCETNRLRKGAFNFLDTLSNESAYWWGFIMADGNLSVKNGLQITLSIKDVSHLQKLSNHIGKEISYRKTKNGFNDKISEMCSLNMCDKKFAEKWLSILEINTPKTYTPPNLSVFYTKDLLLSFFIGFVDGDGCIWESKGWSNLRIELHINWLNELKIMAKYLKQYYDIDSKVKTTKKNTAKIDINTKKDLKIIKSYIDNVEYMERKWVKLDNIL